MRAVVQRVTAAAVEVGGQRAAEIGPGLLALVGIEQGDGDAEATWLAEKLAHLRIFEDGAGKMNLSLKDTGGELLLVPNFTVAGDARKGRRPSFDRAMRPELAEPLFGACVSAARAQGVAVQPGVFRASMRVSLVNDGPVTIWLDSRAQGPAQEP
jgi:D-aminoacyl-tRNA deacylase